MSSYIVLARKWRSTQFSEIVGQGPVVRTLMNAIKAKRLHQAYLFTGSRGIGKTSIARIFAKALRCQNVAFETDQVNSCGKCSDCVEIAGGRSVDVLEIDGASNNGVEAVREIRESAKFLPSSGERKIYIIDEVHMLTTAAFNALLKTLEEPPPHVTFIFATTEVHKIPATILSRCQRFDFRRITPAQIQARLVEITRAEGIQAAPDALELIGTAADGSMRDALSLLDQVIAFAGQNLTSASVRDAIGLIGTETLEGILRAVFTRDVATALGLVKAAYEQGHDLRVLTESLVETLHHVILDKVGVGNGSWKALADLRPLEELELIFQALHYGLDWIAKSPQPRAVLEVILIKCTLADEMVTTDDASSSTSNSTLISTASGPAKLPPALPTSGPAPATKTSATWEGLIAHVRKERPLLASILEHATDVVLPTSAGGTLSLKFSPEAESKLDQVKSKIYRDQLLNLSQAYLGFLPALLLELASAGAESLAAKKARERSEQETDVRSRIAANPVLQEARSLFGAELGEIELRS